MSDRDPTALADIHSHLVPGVDDGARTMDDTLTAVERMVSRGIRKIITTPHFNGSLTRDRERMEERLDEVSAAFARASEAVGRRFPAVEFRRGHEVMLDVPDPDLSDPRLRLAGTRFVLVEWPRLHLPPGTTEVLERLVKLGVRPVVAHPERYVGIDLSIAWAWKQVGALLQVNYGAITGRYGGPARTMAFRLLRRGWADYLASDYHAQPGQRIYRTEVAQRLGSLGGEDCLAFLCLTNPARIFRDELPLSVPPLPAERGFWARMKEFLKRESA